MSKIESEIKQIREELKSIKDDLKTYINQNKLTDETSREYVQALIDEVSGTNKEVLSKEYLEYWTCEHCGEHTHEVEYDYFSLPNEDGNSVDIDHEMSKLAENQLLYRATTRMYTKRMALMKYAITEG